MRKDSPQASPDNPRRAMPRLALAALGIVAATALASAALRQGAADLTAFAPRRALDRAAAQPIQLDDERWALVRVQLERAVSLDADNPDLQEALGRWYERTELRRTALRTTPPQDEASRAQADSELREALAHFRRALVLRPSSAYTWASAALLELRLGELDDEFSRAAARAARLGPWEPEVQLILADIAFNSFDRLRATDRPIVLRAVANGLRRQGDAIFDIASRSGRTDLFCKLPGVGASRQALRCV